MDLAQAGGRKQRWVRGPKIVHVLPFDRFNHPAEGLACTTRRGSAVGRGVFATIYASRRRAKKKDVTNEGRSDYVIEIKGTDDNLSGTKDGISTRLHAILQRNTRILQKPSPLLLIFKSWGTYLASKRRTRATATEAVLR